MELSREPIPLSEETKKQIRTMFVDEHRDEVRLMLLEDMGCSQSVVERIRFDILHLSAGDPAKVRSLVDLAKRDPRDVMAAEYFREDGISKPREWAIVHEVNRKLQARINAGEVKPYVPVRRPGQDQ